MKGIKELKYDLKGGRWLPWAIAGLFFGALVALILLSGGNGEKNQPPLISEMTLEPFVYPTPTAIPAVVVQAEANPVAQQELAPSAVAGSTSSTGQTGGVSESGAIANVDGNYIGDTIGGDKNTTIIVNNSVAEASGALAQTTGVQSAPAVPVYVVPTVPPAIQLCKNGNTVGSGPVLYEVTAFETFTHPYNPAEYTAEFAAQHTSDDLAARRAMQSCFLTEEAVLNTVCSYGLVYKEFKPETGLPGFFWVGPRLDGISITDTRETCTS